MFETDADRLAYLEAFGVCFLADGGEMLAIFDDEGSQIDIDGVRMNSTSPQATCRTCDVTRLSLGTRGARLWTSTQQFTVREHQPDGTGKSVLILDKD